MPILGDLLSLLSIQEPPNRGGSKENTEDSDGGDPNIYKTGREVISVWAQWAPSLTIPT
jgi:hypothetical protein